MNNFYVVSTVPTFPDLLSTIQSTDINNALRNFVKFYHYRDINEMIMRDQYNYWKANIKYLKKNGKRKAHITYHPFEYNAYPNNIIPVVNDLNTPYAFINTNPSVVDPTLSPVSSVIMPMVPQVINMTPMNTPYYS